MVKLASVLAHQVVSKVNDAIMTLRQILEATSPVTVRAPSGLGFESRTHSAVSG